MQATEQPNRHAEVSTVIEGSTFPSLRWLDEGRRLVIALCLSSVYGVALGTRRGGTALLIHGLGVPLALVVIAVVAVPAFAIVLTMANAPIRALGLARATTQAAISMGWVLAGFAPLTALFVITSEDVATASVIGIVGLILGGAFGIRGLTQHLVQGAATNRRVRIATVVFVIFATVLAGRIWFVSLPILSGAQ